MSTSFASYLKEEDPDRRALEEAMKTIVFESAEYLPKEEMRTELDELTGGPAALEECLAALESDVPLRDLLVHTYLESVWDSPDGPERVRTAVAGAQQRLPVLEVALISTALMYGMWLWQTKGASKLEEHRKTKPDGTEVVDRKLTNYPFAHPLREFFRRFPSK